MEPRNSKALIITFVIVLALLIVGYFVVIRGGLIKSDSAIGKKFAPLLGTPKQKDVVVADPSNTPAEDDSGTQNGGENPNDNNGNPDGNQDPNNGNGTQNGGPLPVPKYVPPNLSFPKPDANKPKTPNNNTITSQCSDGKDNDKDGSIDSADNDCHSDGNAQNLASYTPTYNTEFGSKNLPDNTTLPTDNTKKVISCGVDQIPLVFTAEEQAQLDELTREFYRLAPQLKTENDISIEVASYSSYIDTINNAKNLTAQCREQTSKPSYLVNNIDQQIEPLGTKTLFSHWEQDDGTTMLLEDDCFSRPDLCHQVFADYQVQSTIISTKNKGRTERRRNPFYNSSKETYPTKETESYFLQYFPDPRATKQGRYNNTPGSAPLVWDWNDWEKWTQIW
jgi:hypothetical protein